MKVVAYIPDTGRITGFGAYSPPIDIKDYPVVDGSVAMEVPEETLVDYKTSYIVDEVVSDRPIYAPIVSANSIPADGQALLRVSGIPKVCRAALYGPVQDQWDESSGEISLTVNVPGSFILRIDAFPYQDVEVRFNAT